VRGERQTQISECFIIEAIEKMRAYESGNSPEMIRKYYLDLVTPEQAAAWFSL